MVSVSRDGEDSDCTSGITSVSATGSGTGCGSDATLGLGSGDGVSSGGDGIDSGAADVSAVTSVGMTLLFCKDGVEGGEAGTGTGTAMVGLSRDGLEFEGVVGGILLTGGLGML